jgi:transcriptional regulator with XRE-family HTH domain
MGDFIRTRRESLDLTQVELARAVGMDYPTGISAIEVGRNTVPPERYLAFADALDVQYHPFAREILRCTNPWAHAMLFETEPRSVVAKLNEAMPQRVGRRRRPKVVPDGA